jgi:hypothetical protein
MRVYGGVRVDGEIAKECVSGENGFAEQGVARRAFYTALAVVDMPVSVVGDTFSLPYIAFVAWQATNPKDVINEPQSTNSTATGAGMTPAR